jgi:hypothetical protein
MVVSTLTAHHAAMRTHHLAAIVASALCIATLGALAGPPATASASAWNHRWDYLRFPAPIGYSKCVSRRIFLTAGTYRWRLFTAHWAHTPQTNWEPSTIGLHRGWYRWNDCLGYWERASPAPYRYVYRHRSYLNEEATSGGSVKRVHWEQGRFGDGSYHWGSALDRLG